MVKLIQMVAKCNWDDKCEDIFQQLKAFLSSPGVIQKSRFDQPIIVYLLFSEEAINATLVQKVDKEERPVYFVSRMLHAAEMRYQMIEKVAFALVLTTRRIRPYF